MVYEDKETQKTKKQATILAEQKKFAFLDLLILNVGEQELRGERKRFKKDEISYNFDALTALTPLRFKQYLDYKKSEYAVALHKNCDRAELIRGQILSLNSEYGILCSKIYEQDTLDDTLSEILARK